MLQESERTIVDQPSQVTELMDDLMSQSGTFIQLGNADHPATSAKVSWLEGGDGSLVLDISSAGKLLDLSSNDGFRLVAYREGKVIRSEMLTMSSCVENDGRLIGRCPYPDAFEVIQRRDSFRADLRSGMDCLVTMVGPKTDEPLGVALKNLSLSGALVEMPLGNGAVLGVGDQTMAVTLSFPDESVLTMQALLRHHFVDMKHRFLRVGLEFSSISPKQERELVYIVHEIERECARYAGSGRQYLYNSSRLFERDLDNPVVKSTPKTVEYTTPMARQLIKLAEFLDAQMLMLRLGVDIDASELLRQSDTLLKLLAEDREAVLFSLRCLPGQTNLVRHSLAVAVRLVDIVMDRSFSKPVLRALAACALVHDLGKCVLPTGQERLFHIDSKGHNQIAQHVSLLLGKLSLGGKLPEVIAKSVIGQINERLDGSGYPGQLSGEQLDELARLAAVVNAVDTMGRDYQDQSAQMIEGTYRQLLGEHNKFDQQVVKRYIRHFGVLPIGTLLRYRSGQLGWVTRLDRGGQVEQLQLTDDIAMPTKNSLGPVLGGTAIDDLGGLAEIIISPF